MTDLDAKTIDDFHRLYYETGNQGGTWANTWWRGVRVLKCPLDLWLYQELIHTLKPQVIIECGTAAGGSAYFLASMLDLTDGAGEVISIDIADQPGRPTHPRIQYLTGSSVAPDIVATVRAKVAGRAPVMVILDSDHRRDHVLAELHAYADLVTPGSYLVVEDTNVNGHPVFPAFGPGPTEAVDEFLKGSPPFVRDSTQEKFLMGFNPGGFLKRLMQPTAERHTLEV